MNSKTSTLNVRINSELKQKVAEEAKSLGMTITEYIEYILNRNDSGSESVLSESFAEKIKSIFENISVLDEINEISHKNLQKSTEILQVIGVSQDVRPINTDEESDERIIITDDALEIKLHELLEAMAGEEIRFEKDGKTMIGKATTPNDVLAIIINNYHSLITKEL